ncbi:MAG: dTDP-4-dehydrorhamnose reductase [Lachnospiraceae bacterium]|nr:dTDP-4-dehydrorhamnose reductase [Lachnospiraceae bacterium]
MKKIIVTGAGGQLGRAVNRELGQTGEYEFYNVDVMAGENIKKADITDLEEMLRLVGEVKPCAIVNCAAYTAVDAQEADEENAFRINAVGPRNLAIAAREYGARLLHISTDYVFPGDSGRPYTEFDPVGPKSVYGKTKLAGERFVEQFADRFYIIRTAWLYGEGKNFVRTMLKLSEDHDEISVVDDQFGNPTSAAELARAIRALLPTENYGLFHGTCEEITNWAEFAGEIFSMTGKKTRVRPVSTGEYLNAHPQAAPRPAYSALENKMLKLTGSYTFAGWRDALKEYIGKMS